MPNQAASAAAEHNRARCVLQDLGRTVRCAAATLLRVRDVQDHGVAGARSTRSEAYIQADE